MGLPISGHEYLISFIYLISFASSHLRMYKLLAFYMLLKHIICREDDYHLCLFRVHNCGIKTQYKLHCRSKSVIVPTIDSTHMAEH